MLWPIIGHLQGSDRKDKRLKDDKITEVTKPIQGIKCAPFVLYIYIYIFNACKNYGHYYKVYTYIFNSCPCYGSCNLNDTLSARKAIQSQIIRQRDKGLYGKTEKKGVGKGLSVTHLEHELSKRYSVISI
jgi:hypothetical protein